MQKYLTRTLILLLCLFLSGCATAPPDNPSDICSIFRQYPSWYWATAKSRKRWGVPISVQMAIIHQESHFQADAQPPRERILWIIPWKRPTSAYGYSQAVNATWRNYERDTGNVGADRDSFVDSTDFIGWYAYTAHRSLGISRDDAYEIYLAYHEGMGGYRQRSYLRKRWLLNVAQRVQNLADRYRYQLLRCERNLPRQAWWKIW
jgi:hypothetical protein